MISIENYKQMRIWENITKIIIENKRELVAYKNGAEKVINPSPFNFSFEEETVESRIVNLNEEIVRYKKQRGEISDLLAKEGIDVEYIVTGFYKELIPGGWLHNYYIRKIKIEHGGYYYNITEHDSSNKPLAKFDTLEEAVTEVLSYYYYLSKIETVEEAIEKLDFL